MFPESWIRHLQGTINTCYLYLLFIGMNYCVKFSVHTIPKNRHRNVSVHTKVDHIASVNAPT